MTKSLQHIRRELEEVCQMLLRPTPEVLDSCASRLVCITAEIEATRPQWPALAGKCEAAVEARLVRRALAHIRLLLDNAAQFHSGWRKLRAVLIGGYRADGSAAEIAMPRRIFVQG
jgi:hypothetical protein